MSNKQKHTGTSHSNTPSSTLIERRREPRHPAEGEVVLRLGQGDTIIRGELVNVSAGGFQMRYRGLPLPAGMKAEVSYPWGKVTASVVWVWSEDGWTEAGFMILK